ncbi:MULTISPECIES: HPP family protein [Sphingobium]|uniref:Membrane protein n=1 Tax=Sphingobium fuliginis (strain ATCC 27551) TaxID=336203 RepID=A0ABQ1EX73_SPHSA|nr:MULTISPECIES: HPP family protein [Sphingobium]AJR25209.1 membrane protein [Sphingobium sp. YBL2]RYL98698.1 HPP family protein [Sphingobium fuliginis]WDA37505.1 HPP family protein [Sphingobium sp. YC-XJ3]GFZ89441.1 membrane protein [Sphingobium fuliginis]
MTDPKNDVRLIWSRYYSAFVPAPAGPGFLDRLKAASGAIGGIAVTGLLCGLMLGNGIAHPLLVAPMGASAVLLFAVPASPLAQPWPVLGGNIISALVGVMVVRLIPDPTIAAALAVGCAIGAMSLLRCLHPPGGAVALSAVLGATHGAPSYMFAIVPVGVNTALLVTVAILFHRLAGHSYPHVAAKAATTHGTSDPAPILRTPSEQDVEEALNAYGDRLDVNAADLQAVLHDAEMRAAERAHGRLTCGEIMSRDVVTVRAGQPVVAARQLLHERRLLSLPVLDDAGRVQGVVGPLDLVREGGRVQDIASEPYIVHADTPVAALLRPLTSGARREAIVVDDDRRLCGLVTQTDLLTAMAFRA